MVLVPRDHQILKSVHEMGFVTVDHVAALHFPSRSSADLRLRRLREAGYLTAVPMGVHGGGTTRLLYALARRGAEVLRPELHGELALHVKPSDRRSGAFLAHQIERNNLKVVLELLHRDLVLQLVNYSHGREETAVAANLGKPGRRERHVAVADAWFAVLWGATCHTFLVEIDRGTVPLKRMALRYQVYDAWWREGGALARFGGAPLRVLTLTTNERHQANLSRVAPQTSLFWFGTLDALSLERPRDFLYARFVTATGDEESLFT